MPTLPDVTSLGPLQSGQGSRAGANYNAPAYARPIDPIEAPRGVKFDTQVVDTGAGAKALSAGVERAAMAGAYYFGHEAAVQARLNEANSDYKYITETSKIKQAISNATTVEEVNALKERLAQIPDEASANLPEGQREYYKIKASGNLVGIDELANKHIYNINKNNEIAAVNSKLVELADAYRTGDNPTRAYTLETAGMLYEQLAAAGYYDQDTVNKQRNAWAANAVKGQKELLPPRERIAALGGVLPGTVQADELPVFAKAFLNGVAGPESAGKYNVRYTAKGGAEFGDLSHHPNIAEPIVNGPNAGKTSSAAGRYQFVNDTWQRAASAVGANDFTAANQDRAAWWLAQSDYKAKTGRNLAADLQTEGLSKRIMSSLGGTWEAWQSEAGQRKSIAAFNATMTGAPDVSIAMDAGDPDAKLLPVDVRLQMLQKAIADDSRVTSAERAQITELKQDLKTDLDMVANTGVPLDGFRERYQAVYGPQATIELDKQREAAGTLFTVTSNMKDAPTGQLDMLAEQIKPTPDLIGTPLYAQLDANYNAAVKKAAEIKKARSEDMSAYADTLIDTNLRQQAASGDIEAKRNLATARLRTFERLGIPPEAQMPATKAEAKELMAPVTMALPGQEKKALQEVVPKIAAIYGDDLAERVIGFALNTARADQQTQEQAARIFKKLGMGQPVSDTEVATLDVTKTNDAMAAAAGVPAAPAPTPRDAFPDYGASTTPEGEAVAAEIQKQNQPQFPMPNDDAIRDIIAQPTPGRVKAFNRTFGPGAAERVLGASKEITPGRLP